MAYGPYSAVVLKIHDGDTFSVNLDLGFGIHQQELRCRIYGINAPELSTDAGKKALAYLESILPVGAIVSIISHGWDKYGGRFDGEVTYGDLNIGKVMLAEGQAVPLRSLIDGP